MNLIIDFSKKLTLPLMLAIKDISEDISIVINFK